MAIGSGIGAALRDGWSPERPQSGSAPSPPPPAATPRLFRGARDGEVVFTPLAPAVMALHRRLAAAFDPDGVLNPGRMYEGL